jgi:ATP-dependent DNA helicase RecG
MAKSTVQGTLFDFVVVPPKKLELFSPDEIFDALDQRMLESLKEDKRLERKSASFSGTPLAEYLSMWANTAPDGGLIVIGMSDDGAFEGCSKLSPKRLNELEAMQDLCPDALCATRRIPIHKSDGSQDFVVVGRVFYRKGRAVKTPQGGVFARRGDRKKRLTPEEARELAIDKGEIDFEQEACTQLRYPQDFDKEAIRGFAESVRIAVDIATEISDEGVLAVRHLGELKDGVLIPNVACALLFAKEPDKIIPGCKIRFLRFDGDLEGSGEKFNAVKDIWIEGMTVPKIIHEAEAVIASQIRTFSTLGKDGKFYASPEYPKSAWYEAVVNACVHRSYSNGLKNMMIYVKMFDNRLEIESPGPFLPFVTPENIYGTSHPRNPKLMQAMYFLKFVKMAAEGTRRMRDTMRAMDLPEPEFSQKEINYSRVRVTLTNNIRKRRLWVDADAAAIVGAAIARTLTDNETRLLNFVAEHGQINVTETVRATGLSWNTAKKLLQSLVARKILEQVHRNDLERDPKAHFKLRTT